MRSSNSSGVIEGGGWYSGLVIAEVSKSSMRSSYSDEVRGYSGLAIITLRVWGLTRTYRVSLIVNYMESWQRRTLKL